MNADDREVVRLERLLREVAYECQTHIMQLEALGAPLMDRAAVVALLKEKGIKSQFEEPQ